PPAPRDLLSSLHDALPISLAKGALLTLGALGAGEAGCAAFALWAGGAAFALVALFALGSGDARGAGWSGGAAFGSGSGFASGARSEEHTSELQSRSDLVCR